MGMVFWRRNGEKSGYKSIGSSQYRSTSSYSRDYLCMIYEKTKDQVPLGPLLGKQNVQAKEVYWHMPKGTSSFK